MKHLVRAGLALAFALGAFLGLRSLVLQGAVSEPRLALVAPRQEASEMLWANKAAQFSEAETCAGSLCHQDSYDQWRPSAHGSVNCETCHGASRQHKEEPKVVVPPEFDAATCDLCHTAVTGRPEGFPQVDADHYAESTCTSCHMGHQPGPPTAISHEVSAGSDCLSCHSTTAPRDRDVPADHANRTNAQCLTCHERREED